MALLYFRKNLHDWVIEEYKRRYPEIDPVFFDRRKQKNNPIEAEVVSWLFSSNRDLSQIQATFRLSRRAKNILLSQPRTSDMKQWTDAGPRKPHDLSPTRVPARVFRVGFGRN